MFFRMMKGAFLRQWKKMLLIALTIALGASLATAMLNVMLDVGDKVNQELKTYGANITVVPKTSSVVDKLYELEDGGEAQSAYLKESELGNIKTIFWANNIVDFAPFLETKINLDEGKEVRLLGTWFGHRLDLPTGESLVTGVQNLRNWWEIKSGVWLQEPLEKKVMVGEALAQREGLSVGDCFNVTGPEGKASLEVVGIFSSGDPSDEAIYGSLELAQELSGKEGCLTSIEVSALTTPDNELAMKAAKDPHSLTIRQYETWYCTAYVSSVCFQIQQVISDSAASPLRQLAESEGAILEKTQLLMLLITLLSLIGSILGITNLVTASVMERSQELGLLKAIGAKNRAISGLILSEIVLTGGIGGILGCFSGFGFAQIIGQTVFGSAIEMKGFVVPVVALLVFLVCLAGSLPAIRLLLRLKPAEVLHGR